MRLGLVDCSALVETEAGVPWFPSPALMAAAQRDAVYLAPAELAEPREVDRIIACVPAWCAQAAAPLLARSVRPVEVIDPWAHTPGDPGYAVARACHGEVDLAPSRWPVHPWVAPSAPAAGHADARARAAVAGLAPTNTAQLVLGDERVRLTQDRLRLLAELITGALRTRKSLVELVLRVWPEDLAAERAIDHLSLLPVAGLDVLLGSLHQPSLTSGASVDERVQLVAALARAGLGHVTTLSVAVALPGETIRDSIGVLDRALRLAAEHRLAAVRCALWIGDGGGPRDREDQQRRFLVSHPAWTEEEYRGFHDLVAVIRQVAPKIELIGPGFLPSWDAVP